MKFSLTAHRELWLWLAEHPGAEKSNWPGWSFNGGPYNRMLCNCPACQYARNSTDSCSKCPLVWININGEVVSPIYVACDRKGIYGDWRQRASGEKRAELARKIANLQVKEGVETE